MTTDKDNDQNEYLPCVVCKGKGIYYEENCMMCNGTGKMKRE